jgi:hypothetical protein
MIVWILFLKTFSETEEGEQKLIKIYLGMPVSGYILMCVFV